MVVKLNILQTLVSDINNYVWVPAALPPGKDPPLPPGRIRFEPGVDVHMPLCREPSAVVHLVMSKLSGLCTLRL